MRLVPGWLRRIARLHKGVAGLAIVAVYLLAAVCAPLLTPHDPVKQNMAKYMTPPSWAHPLGTDDLGRDLLARILYGARVSIVIAFWASTLGLVIGTALGLTAGYYGGWWDTVAMRFIDLVLSFPSLIVAIAIAIVVGHGVANVIVAVGIYSVPMFARLARSSTQQVRAHEYVVAARSLGASDARVIARYIFPNITASLFVVWTLRMGLVVLTASTLSFLGLGVQPPTPEWGAMLSTAREHLRTSPGLAVYPGLAILGLAMGFNLLGDAMRDVLDPRMRGRLGQQYGVA
jgi:peptide/nickel transport system permease protein